MGSLNSPLKKSPGECTGPTKHARFRGNTCRPRALKLRQNFLSRLLTTTHLMNHATYRTGRNLCFRITLATFVLTFSLDAAAADPAPLKAGMIGLDTSHVPAFAKIFNNPNAIGFKVSLLLCPTTEKGFGVEMARESN